MLREREIDRQTDGQTDIDRDRDRQTDRQREREITNFIQLNMCQVCSTLLKWAS